MPRLRVGKHALRFLPPRSKHRNFLLSDPEELDVVSLNARDTENSPPQSHPYEELVEVVTRAVDWPAEKEDVRSKNFDTVKQFQRLLGLMAAASNVIPFGLLYMRPLQWWLRTKGFSPRGNPFRMIKVTRRCLRALVMWKKSWFLSQGPVLGASCRRKMLTTDASLTGWGAILEGRPSQGLRKDHHLSWHINRLEMLAVFLALKNFLENLSGHHVLVRSDNTSVVSYINHQGVYGHVHFANWHVKFSCGPKGSFRLFEQLTSRGPQCRSRHPVETGAEARGGRSFHQPGVVNESVLEIDFELLCDGPTRRRSLADLRLLEGM